MGKLIDLTGERFGKWTVLGRDDSVTKKNIYWKCQCACGTVRSVAGTSLRGGISVSCGYLKLLADTKPYLAHIGGVHLWGKKMSDTGRKVAHCGNLDTYFGDVTVKENFLKGFKDCFDDDVVRKMVLEVNSGNEDLQSIVSDLKNVGVTFV